MDLTTFFNDLEVEITHRCDLLANQQIRFINSVSVLRSFIHSEEKANPQLLQRDLFNLLDHREEFTTFDILRRDSDLSNELKRLVLRVF